MGILDWIGLKCLRDKLYNSYEGQDFFYFFGWMISGEIVDEFKVMQMMVVYVCVCIFVEVVVLFFIYVYEWIEIGKEKKLDYLLYFFFYDELNLEMLFFIF